MAVTIQYGKRAEMARRGRGRFVGPLAGLALLFLGYLFYGQQVTQTPNPIYTAIAGVLSPTLVLGGFALLLLFFLAVVAMALRSGRSVRFGRGGVSIGHSRR
jgi:hypothetical protein